MLGSTDYLMRCLVEEAFATEQEITKAREQARASGGSVEEALLANGTVTGRDLALARAILCEYPFVDAEQYEVDINNATLLPRSVAEQAVAFPLFVGDGVITVGMSDPLNLKAIDQLRRILRAEIDPVLCEETTIRSIISKSYSLVSSSDGAVQRKSDESELEESTKEEPIVRAVTQIIADAIEAESSDIHISPCEHELQLRYRIDGRLQNRQGPPLSAHTGVVQRLKVMANLDLTQTRRPQDGKFRTTHQGEQYEIRLSTIPTVNGENVVMRILRPHGQILDFAELGIAEDMADSIGEIIGHPHGMFLVTGPTGSGKTSTLYTALKKLNSPDRNIMTIEDPVEIRMHGVRQVQTNAEIGLTFAGALRSILRQDPDIVLLGEIRDSETAMIAMQASLTGHLVLSTLHTNDAPGAVARLQDLEVPPFVINSSLLGVLAQRLVRTVCSDCATSQQPDQTLLQRFGIVSDDASFRSGRGCARCSGSGYRGRTGIYELIRMTGAVGSLVESGAPTNEIGALAFHASRPQPGCFGPMWRDGLRKARLGLTTLDEVDRVAMIAETQAVADERRAAA
ncbi:MAG: GspE/PulE family protein [bacterium]|nr:GspE/PulE family protein [bacterium]